jgi:hypothetical protein
MFKRLHRDEVFIAGGEPKTTYVDRQESHVERNLARAIASPNQIVSVAGPTKTGKTVLCKRILGDREYVWIDGGVVQSAQQLWDEICGELRIPYQTSDSTDHTSGLDGGISSPIVSVKGSKLRRKSSNESHLRTMGDAISALLRDNIILVIDDFHYLTPENRTTFLRNVKGAVFNGLKVLLLSVTHRAFDAIKAESELTGRFVSITVPEWTHDELSQIPELGFSALSVRVPEQLLQTLATEAQDSPFLMQKFCWEICFDNDIAHAGTLLTGHTVEPSYDVNEMFKRLAKDAGLPIYQRLVAGPQNRKARTKRPLKRGGEADIYEVVLLALAETGPKASINYEELRTSLTSLLSDMVPQKHEVTSALKHLVSISMKSGEPSVIDWDDDKREVNLSDPYLRFYLRWQIRSQD